MGHHLVCGCGVWGATVSKSLYHQWLASGGYRSDSAETLAKLTSDEFESQKAITDAKISGLESEIAALRSQFDMLLAQTAGRP